jgi:hypothetical protein
MVKLSSPADNNPRSMEHEFTEPPVDPCDKNVIISALKQKRSVVAVCIMILIMLYVTV